MASDRTERRLAAILSADVVGYSRLMAEDEAGTIRTLGAYRHEISGLVGDHRGRVVDATGDNLLAEFPTALDAAECAVEIQRVLKARNAGLPEPRRMEFRVGVHMGDIAAEGERIYGDGVNIAARLEALAEPGGVCVSATVHEQVHRRLEVVFEDLGEHEVKNIPDPVHVFRVGIEVEAAEAPPRPTRRVALGAAVVVLLLGITAGWWWLTVGTPTPTAIDPGPIRSIAVLPLENLSGDPDQEYFADGMTDALIGHLAKLGSLRVISRTSVMQYKRERKPLPEIAQELNVDAVVEGTVMRGGDRVRITAQLIDARSDHHLWNESYERDLRDVLVVQSEIARAVATQIQLELTPAETKRLATGPVNPEAHDAYLRGLQHVSVLSPREGAKAIELFEQAVALDPAFAEAHAALAYTYQRLGQFLLPAAETMENARAAALRALALDDGSALAHATLGQVLWRYDWEWEAGRRELALAVELSPSDAWVLDRYAIYLSAVERHDDAIALARRAVEAAPFDPQMRAEYAIKFYWAGHSERARDELMQLIDSDPDLPTSYFYLVLVDTELGLAEERRWATQEFLQRTGGVPPWREELLRNPGQSVEEDVRALLAAQLEHRNEVPVNSIAFGAAYLGENDLAFELLEEMYEKRHALLVLLRSPGYHRLRSDPRFDDLLRRIGFPES